MQYFVTGATGFVKTARTARLDGVLPAGKSQPSAEAMALQQMMQGVHF